MNTKTTIQTKSFHYEKNNITELTVCGVFTAIVCIFTMFLQVQLIPAAGGLVHLGNVPLFFAAAFFGKKAGAISGGLGMALSDLLTGWVLWSPFTLVIVGLMGFVFAVIVNKKPTFVRLIAAVVAVLAIKIVGYYITEGIIYGNWKAPLASIPGNVIQIVTAAIIAIPVIMVTKTTMKHLTKKAE